MHQNPFNPAGGAYDAPPDPIVGWGGGYPLPIPLPARRLRRLELGAYGASVLRPPSTQNPGYTSVLILEWVRPPGTSAIDIIAMTSSGQVTSSVTSLIDSARQLSYRLPIVTDLLSSAVSEIVSLKNGHTHNVCRVTLTERDTGTHSAYAWGYDTVNY